MTERIIGPTGSRRRRRFLWVPALLIACTALFVIGSAQAVHDLGFQLDGDVSSACPAGNVLPLCTSSQKDWADLFTVADDTSTPPGTETVTNSSVIDKTNGPFTEATFVRDFETGPSVAACSAPGGLTSLSTTFCTGDDTTFATGSKDTLDISGWQCNHDNNVNSKIDIMNAYAVAYTNPTPDVNGVNHKLLYFGMEKNKDNGTNDVGFWFLQGNASCSAPSGHKTWTGLHTVGDVLVVSEFTNGGGVSNITAYRWVGGANPLTQIGTAGDCKGSLGVDALCATTNSGAKAFNTAIDTPWLTADATLGVGKTGKVVPPDFFEGGIDLTQAFANSGGATVPSCFNTFIADTRSSNVTGSTLFDFARGQLGQCGATIVTTPSLTTTTLSATGAITDLANINGTTSGGGSAPKPTGTVSFSLCGPLASASGCATGGTAVTGNPVTLGNCSPDVAGHSCATSGNVRSLVTAVGTYCFRAVYDPGTDPNYQSSAGILDGSSTECFTVTDTSSIVTDQKWLPNDSATVSTGGGSAVSGTVTFTLYEDADCGVTAPIAVKATFTDNTPGDGFTTTNTSVYTANQTISWKATFASDNGVGGSTSTCETSTVTINNNH